MLAQSVERNTAEREVAGSISGAEPILRVFNEETSLAARCFYTESSLTESKISDKI